MFYVAYGMNTNKRAMAMRCPDAQSLGGFYLPNHKLIFRGVGDILEDKGSIAPVVLWKITDNCLNALDKLEGYPHFYDRRLLNDQWLVYDMNGDKSETKEPSDHYYNMIDEGLREHGLQTDLLKKARSEATIRTKYRKFSFFDAVNRSLRND